MNHPKAKTFKRLRKQIKTNGRSAFLSERTSSWLIWIGSGIIVVGLIIFFWKESLSSEFSIAADKVGQLGDFIGGIVGSLWALAGVILFYAALSLQRKEFKLQRLELKATRDVFKQQSELLKIQQRENTFFHLLENHKKLVSTISQNSKSNSDSSKTSDTGYIVITNKWTEIEKALKKFQKLLTQPALKLSSNDYYNPYDLINSSESFNPIYSSIHYMIQFTVQELNNSEFHLTTIYMNLSHAERMMFGVFEYFKIGKRLNNNLDMTSVNFDFMKDFTCSPYFIEKKLIPPSINYDYPGSKNMYGEKITESSFPSFGLKSKSKSVILQEIYIEYNEVKTNLIETQQELSTSESLTFDLFDFINLNFHNGKIEDIDKNSTNISAPFSIKVVVKFNEITYTFIEDLTYFKQVNFLGYQIGFK